ncbi:MAG: hypothetical protein M1814_006381 [Vezdaea aestivalis]|nr:MAG: hypothetical protein M1814_006381 [Vezdaea aestivalis]
MAPTLLLPPLKPFESTRSAKAFFGSLTNDQLRVLYEDVQEDPTLLDEGDDDEDEHIRKADSSFDFVPLTSEAIKEQDLSEENPPVSLSVIEQIFSELRKDNPTDILTAVSEQFTRNPNQQNAMLLKHTINDFGINGIADQDLAAEAAQYRGNFINYVLTPGDHGANTATEVRKNVSYVGDNFNDRISSMLLVRRFKNEISAPVSSLNLGGVRFGWNFWPSWADGHSNGPLRRYVRVLVPITVDPDCLPKDRSCEIEYWIHLDVDNVGKLRGIVAKTQCTVKNGRRKKTVRHELEKAVRRSIGQVNDMIKTALTGPNLASPFRLCYLLPGGDTKKERGHTDEDVTVVAVRREGLDIADRQNMHSCSVAVRALLRLEGEADKYRSEKLSGTLNGQVLVYSLSHDQQDARLYGHFAVRKGGRWTYRRHRIKKFDVTDLEDLRSLYNFIQNLLEKYAPDLVKRIQEVLASLPKLSSISFHTSEISLEDRESQISLHDQSDSLPGTQNTTSIQTEGRMLPPTLPSEASQLQKALQRAERFEKELNELKKSGQQ